MALRFIFASITKNKFLGKRYSKTSNVLRNNKLQTLANFLYLNSLFSFNLCLTQLTTVWST